MSCVPLFVSSGLFIMCRLMWIGDSSEAWSAKAGGGVDAWGVAISLYEGSSLDQKKKMKITENTRNLLWYQNWKKKKSTIVFEIKWVHILVVVHTCTTRRPKKNRWKILILYIANLKTSINIVIYIYLPWYYNKFNVNIFGYNNSEI